MAWVQLTFGVSDVWQFCRDHFIDAAGDGRIWCWVENGHVAALYDSGEPAGQRDQTFVLFSPELPNKVINRTLTVRKRKRAPSGFLVHDARLHQKVFVVGEFSDEELAPLVQAEIDVKRVPGQTPKEISDNLEELLG